jgi:large subunit ribosomal protein L16
MLLPKRVRFRKQQRGKRRGMSKGGEYVAFGDFGMMALEPAWVTSAQIEACRITMSRHFRRGGKIYIRVFPDKPVTKKPAETRMGKGKGAVEYWVAVVKPGRMMFEVAGVDEAHAREAFRLAGHKLPIKTRMVAREIYDESR